MSSCDLDTIEELSREIGFTFSRTSSDNLEVFVLDGTPLVFRNFPDDEDTLIGFKETPWHSHGKLVLMFDDAFYADFDELDILQGIKNGDILIYERYVGSSLDDRWLGHKREKVDVQYIQPGEEIRIRRIT